LFIFKKTFAEMLGLDTGWNCHISLSGHTSSRFHKKQTGVNSPDLISNDFNEKSAMESSGDKARLLNSKLNKPSAHALPFTSRFHKFGHASNRKYYNATGTATKNNNNNNNNMSLNESRQFSSRSMPSIKLTKFTSNGGAVDTASNQIVKFNLNGVNRRSKYRKSVSKNSHTDKYYKKKKLSTLSSADRSSISSTSLDENNSDSESTTHNSLIKSKLTAVHAPISKTAGQKTSEQSLKSSSVTKSVIKRFTRRKSSRQSSGTAQKVHQYQLPEHRDEDSASSHTNHSGRTLSETEILGNAVSFIFHI
jgi:hypothetical protein